MDGRSVGRLAGRDRRGHGCAFSIPPLRPPPPPPRPPPPPPPRRSSRRSTGSTTGRRSSPPTPSRPQAPGTSTTGSIDCIRAGFRRGLASRTSPAWCAAASSARRRRRGRIRTAPGDALDHRVRGRLRGRRFGRPRGDTARRPAPGRCTDRGRHRHCSLDGRRRGGRARQRRRDARTRGDRIRRVRDRWTRRRGAHGGRAVAGAIDGRYLSTEVAAGFTGGSPVCASSEASPSCAVSRSPSREVPSEVPDRGLEDESASSVIEALSTRV